MKRYRPLSPAQRKVWHMLREANGKVVVLDTGFERRSVKALVKRKWVVETSKGFKLHSNHIDYPTWQVTASFKLDWALRSYLNRKVTGSAGSGCSIATQVYDIDWMSRSAAGAERIKARLIKAIASKPAGTPRVKVRVYPPRKSTRTLVSSL